MRSSFAKFLYWITFIGLASLGLYGVLIDLSLGWVLLVLSGVLLGVYADWNKSGDSGTGIVPLGLADRAKAAGISEGELKAIDEKINREQEITVALVEKFSVPSGRDEPLPPWIKYPGFNPFHIFWRMGAGESYLSDPFGPFITRLDRDERERYFARYDLGTEWPHRDDWHYGWVAFDEHHD